MKTGVRTHLLGRMERRGRRCETLRAVRMHKQAELGCGRLSVPARRLYLSLWAGGRHGGF